MEVRLGEERACTGAVVLTEEPAAPEWREALLFSFPSKQGEPGQGPLVLSLALFACRLDPVRAKEGYEPPSEEAPQARPLMLLSRGRLDLDAGDMLAACESTGGCGRRRAPIRWVPLRPPGHSEGWLPRLGALAVRVYCTGAQGPSRDALGSPGHENESEWSISPPSTALAGPTGDTPATGAGPPSPAPSPPTAPQPGTPAPLKAEEGGDDDHPCGETAEPGGDAAGCEEPGASRTPFAGDDGESPLQPNDTSGEGHGGESYSGPPTFRGTEEAWQELSSGLGRWQGELQRQARSRASPNQSATFKARRRTSDDIRAEQGRRPETTEKRISVLHQAEPVRGLWRERARRSVHAALIGMVCALLVLLVAFVRVRGYSAAPGRDSQDL